VPDNHMTEEERALMEETIGKLLEMPDTSFERADGSKSTTHQFAKEMKKRLRPE
jgi:hypothetical protein